MWIIKHLLNSDNVHYILAEREYVVGRRDCDILVPNDMSISRKHAIIKHAQSESVASGTGGRTPTLLIKDMSKLGTVLRGERITVADTERHINNGDVLEFGTAGISKYSCVYQPFVVTASCLDHAAKRNLKQHLARLGGHVVNDWSTDCSLVVMANLSVTVKVICALISLKSIVTPQYIADFVAAIDSKSKLPDPNDYLPPLAESQVNPSDVSFKPNTQRKDLFNGKTFVFLSAAQCKKLQVAIELAGGVAVVMEKAVDGEQRLLASETCVMSCDAASESDESRRAWIIHVQQLLGRNGRRMITESEIGFAVLYCSTQRFCNPTESPEPHKSAALPMQSFSVPIVSQQQQCSQQPSVRQQTERVTSAAEAGPVVEVKQELASQSNVFRSPAVPPTAKRNRAESDEQRPPKQPRIDPTPTDSTVAVTTRESLATDVEYSASVKVESTFVADSMPTDTRYSDSEVIICGQSPPKSKRPRVTPGSPAVSPMKQNAVSGNEMTSTSEGNATLQPAQCVDANTESEAKMSQHTISLSPSANVRAAVSTQVPEGFLSARQPSSTCRNVNYIKEEALPVSVVVIEHCNLVRRSKARNVVSPSHHTANNSTSNGQTVKNFKRFKKCSKFALLPRCVIGVRDLVVHDEITAQQQEWFDNGLQQTAETSSRNTDKLSQELFNWEPPKRRKN